MNPVYTRILVALDGSAVSDFALQQAAALAGAFQASLRIATVIDPFAIDGWVTPGSQRAARDAMHGEAMALLERAAAAAAQSGVAAALRVLELNGGQTISERIAEEARGWPADLIVLGTHGRRGVERLALGSVAEGVARIASAPALLVRSPAGHAAPAGAGARG